MYIILKKNSSSEIKIIFIYSFFCLIKSNLNKSVEKIHLPTSFLHFINCKIFQSNDRENEILSLKNLIENNKGKRY